MYSVLEKDTIALEIVPYIPKTNRGFVPAVPLAEIINAILQAQDRCSVVSIACKSPF